MRNWRVCSEGYRHGEVIDGPVKEGRAWARRGANPETCAALSRVEAVVSPP